MLKKLFALALASVAFCAIISGWIVPSVQKTVLALYEQMEEESKAESRESPLWLVMEYNGKVAVFSPGSVTPVQILETPVAVLPEADRQMLTEGIRAWSDEELQTLLEDYS